MSETETQVCVHLHTHRGNHEGKVLKRGEASLRKENLHSPVISPLGEWGAVVSRGGRERLLSL